MEEPKLGIVEDTLYVPMLGRIYANEHFKNILYDKKALDLKHNMPKGLIENDTQTQYTYLASASRSANVDRYIKNFIERKPNGINVGVLSEEMFYTHISKKGLKLSTKLNMVLSDWLGMVKMIHLSL